MSQKPKVKIKGEKEKLELMIVNKCPLKNIVKDNKILSDINNLVNKVNKIVIQTYQFLNLFLIYKYDSKKEFPYINETFIKSIVKTITTRNDTRGKPPSEETKILLKELKNFFDGEYKKCIIDDDIMDDTKLNFIMAYEVIDIIKNIENNITEHFQDYVNKFVNISFEIKDKINKIKGQKINEKDKKQLINNIYAEHRLIKNDLLSINNDYKSDKKYHKWINKHKKHIITKDTFDKDSIYYDVCSNPQDYLKGLFYINKQLGIINENNIKKDKEQIKLFQVIPQRNNISPKYIMIDTAALINIVIMKNSIEYLNNVKKYQKQLWDDNFLTKDKEFKRKNYGFNHMIKTDGISCCVLLIKLKDEKPINITALMARKNKDQLKLLDKYIEETDITKEMKNKQIISIDPGVNSLITCYSKDENNNDVFFRYTQCQRTLETRNKKYNKITDCLNKESKINNKTIKEIETELSQHNSKTTNYKKFIEYCKKKNEINRILFEHYSQNLFRKLKFNRYINTQKSETKMIDNFKNKFNKPENSIIILGDYDKKEHMKGKESTINKRIRKIFRNNKYEVFMINEFRTSKLCHKCESECKNFKEREKHSFNGLVWDLLRCNNEKCMLIHNRDRNAAKNMYKITKTIFNGNKRPLNYCRTENLPIQR
jgi:hypothetical protein